MLASRVVRIGMFHFIAGCRKRRLKQGFVLLCFVLAMASFFVFTSLCFRYVCCTVSLFSLPVPVQSVAWEGSSPK